MTDLQTRPSIAEYDRRTHSAETLARETGCAIFFANFQLDLVKQELQQAANWAYLPKGEILQATAPE